MTMSSNSPPGAPAADGVRETKTVVFCALCASSLNTTGVAGAFLPKENMMNGALFVSVVAGLVHWVATTGAPFGVDAHTKSRLTAVLESDRHAIVAVRIPSCLVNGLATDDVQADGVPDVIVMLRTA